ncbi:unnamed protein product [Paramecium primaurelia]|uniref:Uncharacterized protein n=1 Tax=Paramecium primaurelia TaxID=5886 RepID=A0A8S1KLF0_PARPR|nr:unnamed protein product [Paramecium primaurelia]
MKNIKLDIFNLHSIHSKHFFSKKDIYKIATIDQIGFQGLLIYKMSILIRTPGQQDFFQTFPKFSNGFICLQNFKEQFISLTSLKTIQYFFIYRVIFNPLPLDFFQQSPLQIQVLSFIFRRLFQFSKLQIIRGSINFSLFSAPLGQQLQCNWQSKSQKNSQLPKSQTYLLSTLQYLQSNILKELQKILTYINTF